MGGGHRLEAQDPPEVDTAQHAESESPTVADHGKPVTAATLLGQSGHKRKRTAAQTEPNSDNEELDHDDDDDDEREESADEAAVAVLQSSSPARGLQDISALEPSAGTAQALADTVHDGPGINDDNDTNDDSDDGGDDDDDDDDLMVVKRRDVLSSSGEANGTAEGIPLGAVELRGLKKKKKLRIDPGRTSGARTVFDEEGESLQPLALLAKEQLDR